MEPTAPQRPRRSILRTGERSHDEITFGQLPQEQPQEPKAHFGIAIDAEDLTEDGTMLKSERFNDSRRKSSTDGKFLGDHPDDIEDEDDDIHDDYDYAVTYKKQRRLYLYAGLLFLATNAVVIMLVIAWKSTKAQAAGGSVG